jgi:DNA invertase Pin-like site-specific DNA recombinase
MPSSRAASLDTVAMTRFPVSGSSTPTAPALRRSAGGASAPRSSQPRLRCAVYTRKSTEEGLDQEFNSLDAQREACAAFITSQAGLGWKLVADRYDDGGISGGTMERPALQRLLQDIRDRKVDVVVVYKIDRLTRSLADFAKIVEVFDGNGVSFVSVTQQFNTTTSMGRLTLNVLLSFAQFEREVTAERIRDKIAASRKKGMWMGGRIPLGYAVVDRKLVVEPQSAEIVHHMFRRLLELGSVGELLAELRRQHPAGIQLQHSGGAGEEPASPDNAASSSQPEPTARQKLVFMRGPLTYLLTNPIYIGKVKHHDAFHDGAHEPIIDRDLFDRVQEQLTRRAPQRARSTNAKSAHLLTGLLFDETGDRLTPTSSSNHGRRYRYYISARLKAEGRSGRNGWRLPAQEIESLVVRQMALILLDRKLIADWIARHALHAHIAEGLQRTEVLATTLASAIPSEKQRLLADLLHRIVVTPNSIVFEIDTAAVFRLATGDDGDTLPAGDQSRPSDVNQIGADDGDVRSIYTIERPAILARRGVGMCIVVDGPDERKANADLVNLIARSNYFLARLTDGSCASIKQLVATLNVHPADISRILPLAFLAPSIVEHVLNGTQLPSLTPAYLRRGIDLPADWSAQRAALLNS